MSALGDLVKNVTERERKNPFVDGGTPRPPCPIAGRYPVTVPFDYATETWISSISCVTATCIIS